MPILTKLMNLRLMVKISSALAFIVLMMVAISGVALYEMDRIKSGSDEIYNNYLTSIVNLTDIGASLNHMFIWQKSHIIAPNEKVMTELEKNITQAHKDLQNSMEAFATTLDEGAETTSFNIFTSDIKELLTTNKKIIALSHSNNDDEANALSTGEFSKLFAQVNELYEVMFMTNTDGAKVYYEQNQFAFNRSVWFLAVVLIFAVGIVNLVWVIMRMAVARPVQSMAEVMLKLAKEDYDIEIPAVGRKEEIGEMASAVLVFKENAIKKLHDDERKIKEQREKEQQHAVMDKATADFSTNIGGIVDTVSSASAELDATAQSMTGISEQTSDQATQASAASQQTLDNVQSVATATEEMTNSIGKISQQMAQASSASRLAVEEVGNTSQQMSALEQTANKIGEVIDLISGIAKQTNLLALNATIESARAGEAGKGFAVVASEVKELASQTAEATSEISQQISDIQNATKLASDSMDNVAEAISKVDEISTAITAAMEEQSSATQEIAISVDQATVGTQQVNDNIASVSQASQEAGAASGEVMTAAGELSQQAELLKGEVDKFITQVRVG